MYQRYSDLEPISRHTFRKRILYSTGIQVLISISVFLIFRFTDIFFEVKNLIYIVLIITGLTFLFNVIYFNLDDYRGRFKAIYPDSELSIYQLIGSFFFPVLFFGLTLFLLFKEPEKHIRKSLPFRYAFYCLVPLICLQLVHPAFTYWFGSPSTKYIVDTVIGSMNVISYKNEVHKHKNLFGNYSEVNPGRLSSTEIILLVAVGNYSLKEKIKSDPENKKSKHKFDYLILLNNISSQALILSESSRLEFKDYSLLHWLQPNGPIEIFMLESLELSIKNKFQHKLVEKNLEILVRAEEKLARLPASERLKYEDKIIAQKTLFSESKTMKSILFKRNEDSLPVK